MQTKQTTQAEVIENFATWCSPDTTETIKDLYRGWLQSDLADSVDGYQRSVIFFNVERLIELVETITSKPTAVC